MTFQGCVGRIQSGSSIPVISVSIDLPVHTCTQVNELFIKKVIFILQASKSDTSNNKQRKRQTKSAWVIN